MQCCRWTRAPENECEKVSSHCLYLESSIFLHKLEKMPRPIWSHSVWKWGLRHNKGTICYQCDVFNSPEVPNDACAIRWRRNARWIVPRDTDAGDRISVLVHRLGKCCDHRVRHFIALDARRSPHVEVPHADLTLATPADHSTTIRSCSERRDAFAMRIIDREHEAAAFRVEAADATVIPTWGQGEVMEYFTWKRKYFYLKDDQVAGNEI